MKDLGGEQGQAVTEYLVLLSIVVLLFLVVSRGLDRVGLSRSIMKPLTGDFTRVYQYGHPQAKGYGEDGGPENHPRADLESANNFRMFISPELK